MKRSNYPIDVNGVPFTKHTFILDKRELAKICSEINSNYRKYEGNAIATHLSYGIDNKAYIYYFENHGFDNYNIYMRICLGE